MEQDVKESMAAHGKHGYIPGDKEQKLPFYIPLGCI